MKKKFIYFYPEVYYFFFVVNDKILFLVFTLKLKLMSSLIKRQFIVFIEKKIIFLDNSL